MTPSPWRRTWDQKKLRRLYREAAVSEHWARAGLCSFPIVPMPLGLDFVSDTFTEGRRFRVLAVVDDYTRECLALANRNFMIVSGRLR